MRARKILVIVFVVVALFWLVAYIFIAATGKSLLVKLLQDSTHKKVTVGSLDVSPPFNIRVKNLDIPGLLKIDTLRIAPSILWLCAGRIALNRLDIIRPEFFYERLPQAADRNIGNIQSPPSTGGSSLFRQGGLPRIIIKHTRIREGKLFFVDRTINPDGIKINITDLDFSLVNVYLIPIQVVTNFHLRARIPWQNSQDVGKVLAEGWIDFFKKDMQAILKIEDIDGIALYPYYSNWVDLDKARIDKAKLNFNSDIQGLNNNVTAHCHLELVDIVRKPRTADEPQKKAEMIADAVLEMFKAMNQGKIALDFTIHTKMDRPEFGVSDLKMAFEDKLSKARGASDKFAITDVLKLPVKLVEGTVKGATDLTTATIGGVFAVFSEIKKSTQEAFKKEKTNPE